MFPEVFTLIFNTVVALGGIIFAVAYGWSQYSKANKKSDDEYNDNREALITNLSERLEAERKISESIRSQLKTTLENMASQREHDMETIRLMQLELVEIKGRLATYESILQGRNPELEKTLANVSQMAILMPTFMAEVRSALNIKTGKYTEAILKANNKERKS